MSFNPVILTRASEVGVDQPAFLQLNDASPAVQLRYVVEMCFFNGLFMFVSFPCFQLGFIHDVFSSLKLKCLLMFVAVQISLVGMNRIQYTVHDSLQFATKRNVAQPKAHGIKDKDVIATVVGNVEDVATTCI
jgi:hypothetical protein